MDLQDSLRRAVSQDVAFREIYDLTIDRVYSFTFLRLGNRELALDTCQNIYLALWQSFKRFTYVSDAHFYAFLFKIARRQVSKVYRAKTVKTLTLDDSFEVPAETQSWEDYRVLLATLQGLKDRERVCLELRYFQDWKFQDIATALNITENHAKVLHHRALKKLQRALGKNIYA